MSNDMYVHCVSNSCMSEYNLSKKKNTVEPQNLNKFIFQTQLFGLLKNPFINEEINDARINLQRSKIGILFEFVRI